MANHFKNQTIQPPTSQMQIHKVQIQRNFKNQKLNNSYINDKLTCVSPSPEKHSFNKDKFSRIGKMNKSQIIDNKPFRQAHSTSFSKTSRLKENQKIFQTTHVPSIFKKYKKQSINNSSPKTNSQPLNTNTIYPSTERPNIKSRFSNNLQTTYEEQEQYKISEKHIEQQRPSIIVVKKKKTIPIITQQDKIFLKNLPKLNDFDIGQLLGKGAYGTVKVVRHKQTGCFFALKTYSLKTIVQKIDGFIQTVKLQMFSKHPNIAQVYSIFKENDKIYLLMELCMDGDLSGSVKSLRNNKQSVKQTIKGIVCGLTYLHQQQIIHRDIKLQNILISHGMPKITDFDLAVYQKNPLQSRRTFCGSPAYFSPEMLCKYQYNNKVDIWSLGIVCYQILCGFYPFEISTNNLMSIVNSDYKQIPDNIESNIKNFIEIMLIKDPLARANWNLIINHPYLRN